MKEGSCIASKASYAYEILEEDGNRILDIGDAFKADIVKKIFTEYDLKEIISPRIEEKLQKVYEDILNTVKARLNVFDSSSYYEKELNELENEIDKLLDKLLEVDKKDKYADRLIEKVYKYLINIQEDRDKNFIYRLFIKDIIISDKEGIEINWRI